MGIADEAVLRQRDIADRWGLAAPASLCGHRWAGGPTELDNPGSTWSQMPNDTGFLNHIKQDTATHSAYCAVMLRFTSSLLHGHVLTVAWPRPSDVHHRHTDPETNPAARHLQSRQLSQLNTPRYMEHGVYQPETKACGYRGTFTIHHATDHAALRNAHNSPPSLPSHPLQAHTHAIIWTSRVGYNRRRFRIIHRPILGHFQPSTAVSPVTTCQPLQPAHDAKPSVCRCSPTMRMVELSLCCRHCRSSSAAARSICTLCSIAALTCASCSL